MGSVRNLLGCACLGLASFLFASGCGIPVWSGFQIGDAVDIGLLTFFGAWWLKVRG